MEGLWERWASRRMSSQTQDFLQKEINNFSLMLVLAFSFRDSPTQGTGLKKKKNKKGSGSPSDPSMGQKDVLWFTFTTQRRANRMTGNNLPCCTGEKNLLILQLHWEGQQTLFLLWPDKPQLEMDPGKQKGENSEDI